MHVDLCGSDHFPIFLNDIASGVEEPSEKWKLNKVDITNTSADNFSEKSSSENYSVKFRNVKYQQEKQKLKFTSDNTESYNSNFLLTELTDALTKAHDSSLGPDDIHYKLLKHFPSSSLSSFDPS